MSDREQKQQMLKVFMVDDALEHLTAFADYPALAKYDPALYHYNNQLEDVVRFEKEDKARYIELLDNMLMTTTTT